MTSGITKQLLQRMEKLEKATAFNIERKPVNGLNASFATRRDTTLESALLIKRDRNNRTDTHGVENVPRIRL